MNNACLDRTFRLIHRHELECPIEFCGSKCARLTTKTAASSLLAETITTVKLFTNQFSTMNTTIAGEMSHDIVDNSDSLDKKTKRYQ